MCVYILANAVFNCLPDCLRLLVVNKHVRILSCHWFAPRHEDFSRKIRTAIIPPANWYLDNDDDISRGYLEEIGDIASMILKFSSSHPVNQLTGIHATRCQSICSRAAAIWCWLEKLLFPCGLVNVCHPRAGPQLFGFQDQLVQKTRSMHIKYASPKAIILESAWFYFQMAQLEEGWKEQTRGELRIVGEGKNRRACRQF